MDELGYIDLLHLAGDEFNISQTSVASGMDSVRTVRDWMRRGIVRASKQSDPKCGKPLSYSMGDVFILRVCVELRNQGLRIDLVRRVSDTLYEQHVTDNLRMLVIVGDSASLETTESLQNLTKRGVPTVWINLPSSIFSFVADVRQHVQQHAATMN